LAGKRGRTLPGAVGERGEIIEKEREGNQEEKEGTKKKKKKKMAGIGLTAAEKTRGKETSTEKKKEKLKKKRNNNKIPSDFQKGEEKNHSVKTRPVKKTISREVSKRHGRKGCEELRGVSREGTS